MSRQGFLGPASGSVVGPVNGSTWHPSRGDVHTRSPRNSQGALLTQASGAVEAKREAKSLGGVQAPLDLLSGSPSVSVRILLWCDFSSFICFLLFPTVSGKLQRSFFLFVLNSLCRTKVKNTNGGPHTTSL